MTIRPHRRARRRRLGNRAGANAARAPAAASRCGSTTPAMPSSSRSKRESRFLPGVRLDDAHRGHARSGRSRARATRSCWWCRRRRCARSCTALAPSIAPAHAARSPAPRASSTARHKFMTEIIAECAPQRDAGDPLRPELCRRRGARPADRGDARRARRDAGARRWRRRSARATFRPYHSTDVRGVEIGGAAKNVLAIAAGIVAGRGLGASAAAALTTRGFAELVRFGKAFGAQAGDADGPVRPRRSDPDLLEPAVAQFLVRRRARQRREAGRAPRTANWPKASSPRRCCWKWRRRTNVDMPIAAAVAARARRQDERRRGDRVAADAAVQGGGLNPMAYWLMKTEPDAWSWDQQVKKGAKGEAWTGVRNHQAKLNLMKMKKGDRAFFYHSNVGKDSRRHRRGDPRALSRSDRRSRASPGWWSTSRRSSRCRSR